MVTVRGAATGSTELWLSAVENADYDCARLPNATVVFGRPGEQDLRVLLCDLVDERQQIAALRGSTPTAQITLRVTGVGSNETKQETTAWSGLLRFTLEQASGGFSDAQDVPASVTKPGAANGNGTGGGNK